MKNEPEKTVVIFGSSAPEADSPNYKQAFVLGEMLAEAGYVIANGGYGGTMAAAAQAAKLKGAKTIGVTCQAFGRSGPNPWIDKEIKTYTLYERLDALINLADAFVVLPGGTGTLLEIAMVLELINKHFIPKRPIIFLSNYWLPVINTANLKPAETKNIIVFEETQALILKVLKNFFSECKPDKTV